MALRKILLLEKDEDVLRMRSRKVAAFDERLGELMDDLAETMEDADGMGLAAPQVGILRRAVVVDVGEGVIELVNPEITLREGEQEWREACLSVPGKSGMTHRPQKVVVHAQDRQGKPIVVEGEGVLAVALCHEIDHLDGIIYIDHVEGELWDN